MEIWLWVWLGLAATLIVGEIFTAGFFMLPFGLGAVVAAGLALVNAPLIWQWAVFIGVSAVLLLSLRRFADRVTHEPPEKVGADRLIGKQGIVIEAVEPSVGTGRVRIAREEWRADTPGADAIPEGSQVVVERISGTHLVVHKVNEPSAAKE